MVDIFHDDFKLGASDQYTPDTLSLIGPYNDGLVKYGRFVYTHQCFRQLWLSFVAKKEIKAVRDELRRHFRIHYLSQFSDDEFDLFETVFGCRSRNEVLDVLLDEVLPGSKTLRNTLKDVTLQHGVPLGEEHKILLSRLSSRWLGHDATFNIVKCLMLPNNQKIKCCFLTVADEFGNLVEYELLPWNKEKPYYIIPVLARVVWRVLFYGQMRNEPFMFCCDDAEHAVNLPKAVFDYIKDNLNEGQTLFESENEHIYNLDELGDEAEMSQDSFHVHLRMIRDGCLPKKTDPESKPCRDHFKYLFWNVNCPYIPVILNGKQTALGWYDNYFCRKYPNHQKRHFKEHRISLVISYILRFRGKWKSSSSTRNGLIEWLRSRRYYLKAAKRIKHILKNVVPSQWLCLFAKWGFRDRWVLGDAEWRGTSPVRLPVLVNDDEYARYVQQQQGFGGNGGVDVDDDDEAKSTEFDRDSPSFFVDPGFVEALVSWFQDELHGLVPLKYGDFGFYSPVHLQAQLHSCWRYVVLF